MLCIKVRTSFVGYHRWPQAPEAVRFLRDFHRHVFHVEVLLRVGHGDRQVEFFTFKKDLDKYLRDNWTDQYHQYSCEQIAEQIGKKFDAVAVEVSEDGENSGFWYFDPPQIKIAKVDLGEFWPKFPQVKDDGEADVKAAEVPPHKEVKTKPFYGQEAEGPRKGRWTLFVPGGCAPKDFMQAVNTLTWKGKPVEQVYYGAGNDRNLRKDTFLAIKAVMGKAAVGDRLCVEHQDWDGWHKIADDGDGIIMSVVIDGDIRGRTFHTWKKEVLTNGVAWVNDAGTRHVTMFSDPLFATDKYVDEL